MNCYYFCHQQILKYRESITFPPVNAAMSVCDNVKCLKENISVNMFFLLPCYFIVICIITSIKIANSVTIVPSCHFFRTIFELSASWTCLLDIFQTIFHDSRIDTWRPKSTLFPLSNSIFLYFHLINAILVYNTRMGLIQRVFLHENLQNKMNF